MKHLFFPLMALSGVLIHLYLDKKKPSPRRVLEIILVWFLAVFSGLSSIFAFIGHTFAAAETAAYIGWPAGSPFQYEVAIANLAFGALGVSCVWLRGNFWIATVMAGTVFGFGAAFVHIREIMLNANYAPGNAGFVLYMDILGPLTLIILLTVFKILEKKEL